MGLLLASTYSTDNEFVFAIDDGRAMTYPSLYGGFKTASRRSVG